MFHNSKVFGSCITHILYTGCAKIKKNNSGAKRLICFKFRVTSRGDEKRHFPKRRVVLAISSNKHKNNFKIAVSCVVTMEEVQ